MKLKIWIWSNYTRYGQRVFFTEHEEGAGKTGWGPYSTMGALKGAVRKRWKSRGADDFELIEMPSQITHRTPSEDEKFCKDYLAGREG